tara:strand:- start:273 stop:1163 length:891 start_codon:yes stop_codon:yes gene_type:complete
MKEDTQGNPEAVENGVFGSESDDFFSALDQDVNGLVQDEEVTPQAEAQVTPQRDSNQAEANVTNGAQPSEIENLKKRYSDSSREAQNLKAQLNELKPYVPVLNAMKKDTGLVNHVRNYFEQGGTVTGDMKTQLGLDEDFEFDPDDMIKNPKSDSRKVFDAMVNQQVNQKASQIIQQQNAEAEQAAYKQHLGKSAQDFITRNGLTEQEFTNFVQEAEHKFKTEGMTFDDMWLIVNKGKAAANVANSTKKDMLNQMKNVRDIPTSQSSANNAGEPVGKNDAVFDALLGSDGNIEELLG